MRLLGGLSGAVAGRARSLWFAGRSLAQAFQQLRSGQVQASGGSGLGLSISRIIVELHGTRFAADVRRRVVSFCC
jgi:signal transduction histidine kinase